MPAVATHFLYLIDPMFRRLFSTFSAPLAPVRPQGSVPPGERVYAVGDIHGRLDLLDELLDRIETDNGRRQPSNVTKVFLGDLIDRGPASAQVVQQLLDLSVSEPNTRFLMGNHEEVFLKALEGDKGALPFFVKIGGKPTILSYGVNEQAYRAADYPTLFDLMIEHVPPEHIAFLSSFEDMVVIGDYAFVHAGVQPHLPLTTQAGGALRWIREEFLHHPHPLEKIVVHGHTISDDVEETACRIGIDTGAYATGRLTAMGFEGDRRWIVQTGD
jgi:serine/threonine protein phosphatase 1